MSDSSTLRHRLLAFSRELQRALTFVELLEVARAEVVASIGYPHVWLFVSDTEDVRELRLIEAGSSKRDEISEHATILTVKGDAMLEEIVAADEPVVVEDARTDPRTDKAIVAQLGNRTIVNVPLRLVDKPFGALGVGTFGDEGCRVPTQAELDHLVAMAGLIAVAASRIRLVEQEAQRAHERRELEQRLAQTQRLESLGKLAGGVAHDFNNLLTVILGAAALLKARTTGRDYDELGDILGAAERGRELTKQLLAMSRSQALELRPLDLDERLHPLLAMLRRVLPKNIELAELPGHVLPLVEGDASQVDQVVMNLVLNARDAMPAGGRLTVANAPLRVDEDFRRSHPWARAGHWVCTTVADTGEGMSPDVVERIFEPFFTTRAAKGGTGLGLAVAHGIVHQHGGLMHCDSEVGVGTTFQVLWPAMGASVPMA